MSRLMSVAFTEAAVVERRKTVTRRKGWWLDARGRRIIVPGDRLTLCRKVMGRKPGEPLVRLAEVEVVDVRRERLGVLIQDDGWRDGPTNPERYARNEMRLEGFPGLDPWDFVERYFIRGQRIRLEDEVTRIEWRYLPGVGPTRPSTDDARRPDGGRTLKLKRACNGCGRVLGDVTDDEVNRAMDGRSLPDVRSECGCGGAA